MPRLEYVLGVCHDQTVEKAAQDALRDADRRKDEFLATLAHELRNPLAPIRTVLQVNSGLAGLELVSRAAPDVIFLELGMLGTSGFEVARRLRSEPELAATTLVALRGWGSDDDRLKSKEAGFDRHLVKPTNYAEVEALLDQLAARSAGSNWSRRADLGTGRDRAHS